MLPKWVQFFGDFRVSSDFLDSKPSYSLWVLPMFLDCVCRAFGQVVFANNPVSGLLVVMALLIADPVVAGSGLFTATVATIFSWFVGQPRSSVCAGLTAYCGVVVGTVTTSVMAPYMRPFVGNAVLWAFLFVGAVLSVYATAALSNILGSLQPPLPCLTLPFNMVTYLLMSSLAAYVRDDGYQSGQQVHPDHHILNVTVHVEYVQMLSGSLLSAGQVYAVNSMTASALIFLAMLLFSPTMAAMAYIGALLGTLTGVMTLGSSGLEMAATGTLGYNSLLSAAAVGGVFYVISWRSFCAAMFNAIMTTFLNVTLMYPMQTAGVPVLTMPFVLSTLIFLAASSDKDGAMARPQKISFPEMHRMQHVRMLPS